MNFIYVYLFIFFIQSISNQEFDNKSIKFLEDLSFKLSSFNRQVIQFVKSHAHPSSTGNCAKYVANAIDSTGTKVARQPSAYMYGQNLIDIGYSKVSCTGALPGDIIVCERSEAHVHGHIEIKGDDGYYYSDFKQKSYCPYSEGCTIRCYRHQ